MGAPFRLIQQQSPAKTGQAVNPTTNVVLSRPCSLVFCATTGNLIVFLEGAPTTQLIFPVTAGDVLPIRVVEFHATNGVAAIALFTD